MHFIGEKNILVCNELGKSYSKVCSRLPSSKIRLRKLLSSLLPFNTYCNRPSKEFFALQNISFKLEKGKSLGIVGLNGSGKSTLMQLIAGTIKPSTGQVLINGKVAALLELGSGFNPDFTGKENIFLNASLFGLSDKDINNKLPQIEAFAEIGSFIDQPVSTYSSGMSMRLAFAVIANVEPDILIIDEALSVGDIVFTQKCLRFLRSYKKNHSLVLVSHDLTAIKALCDKCLWIDKGELMAIGSTKQVAEQYLTYTLGAEVNVLEESEGVTNLNRDSSKLKANLKCSDFVTKESEISGVSLTNTQTKKHIYYFDSEQEVTLTINARCHEKIVNPVVGFFLRDRLGQDLFGENSFSQKNKVVLVSNKNSTLECSFTFVMPCLPKGHYSFSIAIAKGDINNHTIIYWKHDALIIKSDSVNVQGLVGIDVKKIDIKLKN